MSALLITPEVKDSIKSLVAFAETNPLSMETLMQMVEGNLPPISDNSAHTIDIPIGYRAVLSIELQAEKIRHLSVSSSTPNKSPHPAVIRELMPLFGFKNTLDDAKVWTEKYDDRFAVNVAEAEQY